MRRSATAPAPAPATATAPASVRPPRRIAVLADDLTSAADGAAPFRRAGHRARVLLAGTATGAWADGPGGGGPEAGDAADGGGVVALDLGSRLLDEAGAVSRTRRAARTFAAADLLLKTVDSTLRGHVAAELRAARDGAGRRAVVIAPAFPAEGRTTVAGVQYVRGVRVDESEFARDPAHPVRTADLTRLLPEAEHLTPDGLDELPRRVASAGGVFVCSAATDEDLDRIVAAVRDPRDVLWVGSPGLAAALARHHGRTPAAPLDELPRSRRPLIAVGSANPATRRQLALLAAEPDTTAVVADDPGTAADKLRAAESAVRVLHTPDERRADPDEPTALLAAAAARFALDPVGGTAARAAGGAVEGSADGAVDGAVDGLLLTGGATAEAVLRALGAEGIDLHDEPEPGVARGVLLAAATGRTALSGPGALPVPVLVKAGGFGDARALLRLCDLLRSGGE
ncbi:four-carbon acid sugar kinase family protein [Streptomyces sp. NPDC003327]